MTNYELIDNDFDPDDNFECAIPNCDESINAIFYDAENDHALCALHYLHATS